MRRGAGDKHLLKNVTDREIYATSALLILALVMTTALASSRSRMGIISASLSIAAMGILIVWRSRQRGFAIASVILGGGTIMVLSQGRLGQAILDRFLALPEAMQGAGSRWQIWSETRVMVGDFPFLGIGWGAYARVFRMFRESGHGIAVEHAENDYLQLLAEVGVLGGILVVAGAMIVALPILRRRVARPDYGYIGYGATAGLLAIGLHSLVDSIVAVPGIALVFSVLMGLTIAWWRLPGTGAS